MKRTQLAQQLSLLIAKGIPPHLFLIGFDGFIDEIFACVSERTDRHAFQPIETIHDFGTRILEARGKSTNIELVLKQKKIGGNGPIVAEGLTQAGFSPILIGALGLPEIDPIFRPLTQKCKAYVSLANPGHSSALEFQDGKIIFGRQEAILEITEETLREKVAKEILIQFFNELDTFVSVNWTMILSQTKIWEYLLTSILPKISSKKPRTLFVDLADPAKRNNQDLIDAMNMLQKFTPYFSVTLGLNELEAIRLSKLFEKDRIIKETHLTKDELLHLSHLLLKNLKIQTVIIHATKHACAVTENEEALVDGPYCEKPVLTTGGGDNFNAGFLTGLALNLSLPNSLLLGVATSGYYVRTGKSPTFQELIQFLRSCDKNPLGSVVQFDGAPIERLS
jgi:hypothetical protein